MRKNIEIKHEIPINVISKLVLSKKSGHKGQFCGRKSKLYFTELKNGKKKNEKKKKGK